MASTPLTPVTAEFAARHFAVSARTLSNWAAAGFITRWKVPNQRGLVYDLDEISREIAINPKMRPLAKSQGTVVTLSAPIRVKDVPVQAVQR